MCLTRCGDEYGALDNHCPHQGGPLGEGSIENGLLRCPWHGYDYDPLTGTPPRRVHRRARRRFPVEVRDDGVYVALARTSTEHVRTVSDVMVETMVAWGVTHVFGMVGHSNLGFADALRRQEEAGQPHASSASATKAPRRSRRRAYGKLTGRPAACFAIAGPGSTNLLTGLYDAKVDRAPVLAISGQVPSKVLGRGAFQDLDLHRRLRRRRRGTSKTVLPDSDHAELTTLALKHAIVERDVAHLVLPDEVQVQPAPEARRPVVPGRAASPTVDVRPPAAALDAARSASSAAARRPVIVVGHGARFDMDDVRRARRGARRAGAHHLQGQGPDLGPPPARVRRARPQRHARWRAGCMNESDLLVVFGASFSNHTGIAAYKPIVQVDFDPMALGRFHPVTVPVLGDVGVTARPSLARAPDPTRAGSTSAPTSPSAGRSGGPRRRAASPTTGARASARPRCSTR